MRALAILLPALLVAGGIWVFGALVTDDFVLSSVLTALWLAALGLAVVFASVRRRALAPYLVAGFLVPAVVLGGYLALTTFRDTVVNEDVASADAAEGNVELASGRFAGDAHPTSGGASILRLAEGGRALVLTNLDTSPGPDLRVYLVAGDGSEVGDHTDLGRLKGNKGTQQYAVPDWVDIGHRHTVVIWCRAFTVAFGRAPLTLIT
jgi:hypothetical protein